MKSVPNEDIENLEAHSHRKRHAPDLTIPFLSAHWPPSIFRSTAEQNSSYFIFIKVTPTQSVTLRLQIFNFTVLTYCIWGVSLTIFSLEYKTLRNRRANVYTVGKSNKSRSKIILVHLVTCCCTYAEFCALVNYCFWVNTVRNIG